MVPFGGWDMPLEYTGTIEEHMACRRSATVFDVSHLGTVRISGPDAFDRLQRTLTNDLAKIAPGRAQYTHLLDETDGSVLDDIIVWWHPEADAGRAVFDVMPNASNTDRVLGAIGGDDITTSRAVLAVQGPRGEAAGGRFWPEAGGGRPLQGGDLRVGRRRVRRRRHGLHRRAGARDLRAGREGRVAVAAIVDAGVQPAGLGARDTLRLEAGLPLHGHELGPGITPLQAGLAWVVAFDKPEFRGKQALIDERERGVERYLVGIATEGRRPPRSGCAVIVDGDTVGEITSGNFSPVLGHGIALAFVKPDVVIGDDVEIDVRGSGCRAGSCRHPSSASEPRRWLRRIAADDAPTDLGV